MDSISKEEIVNSLHSINGTHFHINDLREYAGKVLQHGKAIIERDRDSQLLSYILYYDNESTAFISMVWTNDNYQGKGLAKSLIKKLIKTSSKEIMLEVHENNPAYHLYKNLKFEVVGKKGPFIVMRYLRWLAIMQPYCFPYMGYFHLCEASDKIVFLDDVNFISRGWINRNKILLGNSEFLFTIPIDRVSQNKLINESAPLMDQKFFKKFYAQLDSAYRKAPFYNEVMSIITVVLSGNYKNVSDLAINSILKVYEYLEKELDYTQSSICSPNTKGMDKADRIIQITKDLGYEKYINLSGGKEIYNKEYFQSNKVQLNFIHSGKYEYRQFDNEFVPSLSIIDVLMFNDKNSVKEQLFNFTIE